MLSKWLLRSTRRICISTLRPTQLRISSIRGFADDASSAESRTSAEGLTAKQLPQQDGEVPEFFNFTLSCPHKELYTDSPVRMVAVPGSEGRFAATPGHIPVIAELQPGILSLYHERSETSGRQDHYFVSGGMALIHPNSVMEIAAVECVNLSDMDANNIREGLAKAKEKLGKANDDKETLEAEIEIGTYEALELALGGAPH